MREIDDEFDSSDVVRYTPLPERKRERITEPVDASMVLGDVDDDELDSVIAQLDEGWFKGDHLARRR